MQSNRPATPTATTPLRAYAKCVSLPILLLLLCSLDLRAQCVANLTTSIANNEMTLTGSGGHATGISRIWLYVDDRKLGDMGCNTPNCELTRTWSFSCANDGEHTAKVLVECPGPNAQKTETFVVDGKPTISITQSGPTPEGVFSGQFIFNLPNTADGQGRLEYWFETPTGTELWDPPIPASGAVNWSKATACWPAGSYKLKARVKTCAGILSGARPGDSATAETMLVVPPHKPTASLALDSTNLGKALVTWSFPQTSGTGQSSRLVRVMWESDNSVVWQTGLGVPITGQQTIDLPACVVGTRDKLKVTALACNDYQNGFFESGPLTLPKCERACCGTDDADKLVVRTEEPAECVAAPIRVTSGNMRMSDRDELPGAFITPLQRTYDSRKTTGLFGRGWTSVFDATLKATGARSANERIVIETESGESAIFALENGVYRQVWPVAQSAPGTLVRDAAGDFLHRHPGSTVSRVYRGGKLVALREAGKDHEVTITYDAGGVPTRVADSRGAWAWTVTSTSGRIATIAVDGSPDLVSTYTRNGDGDLTKVSTPVGTWRTYTYTSGRMETARNGAGHLIESHVYDASGQALTSSGGGGEVTAISYNVAGRLPGEWRTHVTYASGRTTDYYSGYVGGKLRTVEIQGSCNCSSEDGVFVRDTSGRIVREQDALGYVTERQFSNDRLVAEITHKAPSGCDPATDALRCRLTPDTLATAVLAPTAETRTVQYEYADPNWPDHITKTTTESVLKTGGTRRETFTYDPLSGAVVVHSVTGWTEDPVQQQTHTTTTVLYDGTQTAAFDPGGSFNATWLVLPQPRSERKSIDEPRVDVQDVTTFVYYPIHESVPSALRGRLAAWRNALGHISRFEDYDVFGNARRIIDPNGVINEMSYDSFGRLTTTILRGVDGCDTALDPLCATDITRTRVYDGSGPLSTEISDDSVTSYTYDDRGRVETISRGPSLSDLRERIEYEYDPATTKKRVERVLQFENGSWVEKKRESYSYNTSEQLSTVTHADNATVEYTYGPGSRLESVRDENHSIPNTTYAYDIASRIKQVTQTLAGAAGGSIKTRYAYDRDGNLTSVTDSNGNVTTYRYDDFGQLLQQVSPVTGTTKYIYDAAGQLLSTTVVDTLPGDGRDTTNTTTRSYDALGRVLTATSVLPGQSESVSWSYDSGTFGTGRLSSMTDPTGSTAYRWDRRGLLLRETKIIEGAPYATGFQYDAEGNRSRITYSSGRVVDYQFDYASRPISATSGATTLVTSASYLPFGPVREIVFGNGTVRTMTHDLRYRPLTNALTGPEGVIASYQYEHDAAGNITRIADLVDPAYDRNFAYDDLHRLVTANSGVGLWGAGSYSYDAMGNMRSAAVGGNLRTFQMAGTTPKIASVLRDGRVEAVSYDSAGNEIAVGAQTFAYSPRNQLSDAGARSFAYDGRGIRTSTRFAVTLASLSLDMTTAGPNQTVTGTITLSSVAPIGGVTVRLSTSGGGVTVPPEVMVEASQTSATFTIAVAAEAQPGDATLTATYATTLSTALTITSGPTLSTFTATPPEVIGGNPITVAVSLSEAAPEGGVVVAITAEREQVVSGTVPIAAGETTGTAVLYTTPVLYTIVVPLNASYGSSSLAAQVEVRPETITDVLMIDPDGVVGGASAIGTISLSTPAPVGGRTFTLTSAMPAVAEVPASVEIAEGAQTATFPITTFGVASSTPVTITATDGPTSLNATLTVVCTTGTTPAPSFPSGQTIFIDETLPAAAAMTGSLQWDPTQAASGMFSLVHAYAGSGTYRTTITGLSEMLSETDKLFVYARVADCAVPREILIRAKIGPSTVTAYWGDPIWGVTPESINMGAVPPAGSWVRLDVLLRGLQPGGGDDFALTELELAHVDGQVWFDRIGRIADCAPGATEQPSVPSDEDVFMDEETPAGVELGGLNGTLAWTSAQAASGSRSLVHPYLGLGTYVTAIGGLAQPVTFGGKLSLYVRIDECSPPVRQIHLRLTTTEGSGSVSWGEPLWDTNHLTLQKGAVPASGDWVRLEVPLHLLGLDSGTLTRLDIAHVDGRIWFDRIATWPMSRAVLTGFVSDQESTVPIGTTITWTATATGTAYPLEYRFERRDDLGNWSIVQNYGMANTYTWTTTASDVGTNAVRVSVRNGGSLADFEDTATLLVRVVEGEGEGFWLRESDVRVAWWKRWLRPPSVPVSLGVTHETIATSQSDARRHSLYSPELQLLAETEITTAASPAVEYEYVWFAGQPIAQITTAAGAIDWYFNDHLGTPILQTDAEANLAWRVEYDPYGVVYQYRSGAGKQQPLRFPGQENDGISDLSYNVFRHYRAWWGRYTQADPIGLNGGPHLYAYVGGQPTVQADPFGLFTIPRDRNYNKCRTLRKGHAQRELDRVRRKPRCRNFFRGTCNTNIDKLFTDPLPHIQLVPESKRPSGGAFDTRTPDVIYISMRECKSMEDFSHTLIHELGHYGDYHNNNDSISDANHSDGCRAEIECFGFTRGLNCQKKGFQPYKPPKRL